VGGEKARDYSKTSRSTRPKQWTSRLHRMGRGGRGRRCQSVGTENLRGDTNLRSHLRTPRWRGKTQVGKGTRLLGCLAFELAFLTPPPCSNLKKRKIAWDGDRAERKKNQSNKRQNQGSGPAGNKTQGVGYGRAADWLVSERTIHLKRHKGTQILCHNVCKRGLRNPGILISKESFGGFSKYMG